MPTRPPDLLHDLAGTLVGIAWGAAACAAGWVGRIGLKAFVAWHRSAVEEQVKATQGPLVTEQTALRTELAALARTMTEHVAHDAQALDRLNETLARVERGQAGLDEKLDATHDSVIKLATETEWIKNEQKRLSQNIHELRNQGAGAYYHLALEREKRGGPR